MQPTFSLGTLKNELIKNTIAVASGKGGVGKSSVSALLSVFLKRKGYRVGLMDADITGPSIPRMFGVRERPQVVENKIQPVITKTGIKMISLNLFLENEDDPVIWRGPLITKTIKQFWEDVDWDELDFMIIDLPPGTSDATLTVAQSIPLSGMVLITSPQELALMIVKKALGMAQKMNIKLLGIVENMSYVVCPKCGERISVFGDGKVRSAAEEKNIPFFGKLPIDPVFSELCDKGKIEDFHMEFFTEVGENFLSTIKTDNNQGGE